MNDEKIRLTQSQKLLQLRTRKKQKLISFKEEMSTNSSQQKNKENARLMYDHIEQNNSIIEQEQSSGYKEY